MAGDRMCTVRQGCCSLSNSADCPLNFLSLGSLMKLVILTVLGLMCHQSSTLLLFSQSYEHTHWEPGKRPNPLMKLQHSKMLGKALFLNRKTKQTNKNPIQLKISTVTQLVYMSQALYLTGITACCKSISLPGEFCSLFKWKANHKYPRKCCNKSKLLNCQFKQFGQE